MEYLYDKIYPYSKILQEVKDLILPTILESIDMKDVEKVGLRKEDYAEVVYSQIMALGYNSQDINSAINDLMPTRNPFVYPGPEETDAVNMAIHLSIICKNFAFQIRAFQSFHQMTQNLKSHDEVIKNVKMHFLPIL